MRYTNERVPERIVGHHLHVKSLTSSSTLSGVPRYCGPPKNY